MNGWKLDELLCMTDWWMDERITCCDIIFLYLSAGSSIKLAIQAVTQLCYAKCKISYKWVKEKC